MKITYLLGTKNYMFQKKITKDYKPLKASFPPAHCKEIREAV